MHNSQHVKGSAQKNYLLMTFTESAADLKIITSKFEPQMFGGLDSISTISFLKVGNGKRGCDWHQLFE